jgi:hypothetical protein
MTNCTLKIRGKTITNKREVNISDGEVEYTKVSAIKGKKSSVIA